MDSKEVRVRGTIYESYSRYYDDNYYSEKVDIYLSEVPDSQPGHPVYPKDRIIVEGPLGIGMAEGFNEGDEVEFIIRKVESSENKRDQD